MNKTTKSSKGKFYLEELPQGLRKEILLENPGIIHSQFWSQRRKMSLWVGLLKHHGYTEDRIFAIIFGS